MTKLINADQNKYLILLTLFIALSSNIYSQVGRNTKYVSNEIEFFLALDDNTEIVILTDTLNFTLEYLQRIVGIQGNYAIFPPTNSYHIDQKGLCLYGYNNLKIKGRKKVNIISVNNFDNIMTFKSCKGIELQNLDIFHTPKTCNGSVLSIYFSENITVHNCSLNGSGGIGVKLIGTDSVLFKNVEIFDNVFYAIYSYNSENILFDSSRIYKNHGQLGNLILTEFSELIFRNCKIEDNKGDYLYNYTDEILNKKFKPKFINCEFKGNTFKSIVQNEDIIGDDDDVDTIYLTQIAILDQFFKILMSDIESDHDGNTDELLSFFSCDSIQIQDSSKVREDFFHLYNDIKYSYQRKYFEAEEKGNTYDYSFYGYEYDSLGVGLFLVTLYLEETIGNENDNDVLYWIIRLNENNDINSMSVFVVEDNDESHEVDTIYLAKNAILNRFFEIIITDLKSEHDNTEVLLSFFSGKIKIQDSVKTREDFINIYKGIKYSYQKIYFEHKDSHQCSFWINSITSFEGCLFFAHIQSSELYKDYEYYRNLYWIISFNESNLINSISVFVIGNHGPN